jgi:hypothetical protein
VEPAVHRLAFEPDADPVLARLEAELAGCHPRIRMRRVLVFESETWDLMLRARVADALMRVCDHGDWQRLFRPLD